MISKSDQSISSSYDLQEWLNNYNKKVGEPTQIKDYVVTFKAEEKKEYYLLVLVQGSYHLTTGQVISNGIVDTFKDSYSLLQALGQLVTFHWQNLSGSVGIVKSTNSFLNSNLLSSQAASLYFRWAALLLSNLLNINN